MIFFFHLYTNTIHRF